MNWKEKIEEFILPSVEKPERYTGGEVNICRKSHEGKTSIALAFPDIYEVGFSNLGLKILYHIVNQQDDFVAERAYSPWFDCEDIMRREHIPLTTIETFRPLNNFDIVGFTLQHELSYTNIINMLNLGDIPLLSSQRKELFPLIIAGGQGAFNPAPLDEFVDLFVAGDGEEVIIEILQAVHAYKSRKNYDKTELLTILSKIPGVYIPVFYDVSYLPSGEIAKIHSSVKDVSVKIQKRVVKDLDKTFYPDKILLPMMEVVHDRAVIELFRGCNRGCRFCQSGFIQRPVRERSFPTCMELSHNLIKNTGYSDMSLSSLSSTDYSSMEHLMKELMKYSEKQKVAISLPSMRIDNFSEEMAREIKKVKKTGFTFAPEAGSERLRKVINKQVTEDDLLKSVETALLYGWKRLKLYFMIGLPTETEEDLKEIVNLVKKVFYTGKKYGMFSLNVSFSSFVPKPHTPFQWEPQDTVEVLKEKQHFLFENIKGRNRQKNIFLSFHDTHQSFLEGVFARGDRRLSRVIMKAWELGCRFDNWSDRCRIDLWHQAFADTAIEPSFYANRKRSDDEVFPWEHLSCGISGEFLIKEREKAFRQEETHDCRTDVCTDCGVCENLKVKNILYPSPMEVEMSEKPVSNVPDKKFKIRFKFQKTGNTKYISHLGLIRIMIRAVRASGFPVIFSQGFSPLPRLSFGPALSSGVESISEWTDILMSEHVETDLFVNIMNKNLPDDLRVINAYEVPDKSLSLSETFKVASYKINLYTDDAGNNELLKKEIMNFFNQEKILFKKVTKKMSRIIDIRPLIFKSEIIRIDNKEIFMELWIKLEEKGTIKVIEVIEAIKIYGIPLAVKSIVRTGLLTGDLKEPV